MATSRNSATRDNSNGASTYNHKKVKVIDVQSLRQQLVPNEEIRDSLGKLLLWGDVALQADLKQGGEVLIALNALEALDLANRLIARATGQLQLARTQVPPLAPRK